MCGKHLLGRTIFKRFATHKMKHVHDSNCAKLLTLNELKSTFHLSVKNAANLFQMKVHCFRKQCRRLGIVRWPFKNKSKQHRIQETFDFKINKAQEDPMQNVVQLPSFHELLLSIGEN
jgi:RWP-RK domain